LLGSLKLRQLRLLVALDNERKLQLAAERLNITQSAASKMLAEIESIARVPLFERTPRGVEPTDYGAILVRGSRSVLANLDQATDELAGYIAGELGAVSVGTVVAPCLDLIIDVMQYLGKRLDKIKIRLEVATSPPLVNRLLAHELDFIMARLPASVDPRAFDYFEISDEQAGLLVRAEHPLADRNSVDLEEMVELQWICQPPGSFLRQSLERLFYRNGISPPRRTIDTESFTASLAIAARMDAIVPMPLLFLDIVDRQRFRFLQIEEPLVIGSYGLVKLRDRKLSPAGAVVYEAIKQCAEVSERKVAN
jgi:DNA-binding transcriptional LysR family regulator